MAKGAGLETDATEPCLLRSIPDAPDGGAAIFGAVVAAANCSVISQAAEPGILFIEGCNAPYICVVAKVMEGAIGGIAVTGRHSIKTGFV